MSQQSLQRAPWLYDQTRSLNQPEWKSLDAGTMNQWSRLTQFVEDDRTALGSRLRKALDHLFAGLGHRDDPTTHAPIGVGVGFAEIKDVIRELDPKGPIT